MATMTFLVNDGSTSSTNPGVWVEVTENPDGTLTFKMWQEGGIIGDLQGVFFDVADESVIGSLSVSSTTPSLVTAVQQGDDSVTNLGGGVNMNGLLGSGGGYDVGIKIGTSGMAVDDIQVFEFTLDSNLKDLTLADLANMDFGVRLTSVGTEDGSRALSSKISEQLFAAVDAQDDCDDQVLENNIQSGNVFDNDIIPAGKTPILMGWDGGALDTNIVLADAGGATVRLNSDGSYIIDASTADTLSEGEVLEFTFHYTVRVYDETNAWSEDTAEFCAIVVGVNDRPDAQDDDFRGQCLLENDILASTVISNDSDIDRLDIIKVMAVNGVHDGEAGDLDSAVGSIKIQLASGALVTMAENGDFSYDTNHAFDYLLTGQEVQDSFVYTLIDNHGATDDATAIVCIDGEGVIEPPTFDFPTMHQALSNLVLYLDDGDSNTAIMKVKFSPTTNDVFDADNLQLPQWILDNNIFLNGNIDLVGFSIHAGTEYPLTTYDSPTPPPPEIKPLGPGEGQFYLYGDGSYLPGESDYQPTTSDPAPSAALLAEGITAAVLAAHADHVVSVNVDPLSYIVVI